MPDWLKTTITIVLTLIFSWNTFGPGSQEETIVEETESETQPTYSYRFCDYCDNQVPEDFMYTDQGDFVCPDCVYGSMEMITSKEYGICYNCGYMYQKKFSYGFGLCEDCTHDLMDECAFCYNYTFQWPDCDWFTVCPKCLSSAYHESDLESLLLAYFEQE